MRRAKRLQPNVFLNLKFGNHNTEMDVHSGDTAKKGFGGNPNRTAMKAIRSETAAAAVKRAGNRFDTL